ncbi:MAG TPA: sugar ABC transporter substrate-binding protein, partial [Chloroflexota bacterium]|nr:sugar ABC transporter substrate-binding protein [Chloroflexota bacterium]
MQTSRRRLLGAGTGLLALGTTAALAACGAPAGSGSPSGGVDAKTTGTVRYLTWWTLDRAPTMDEWKKDFKEEFPNVTIEPELITLAEYNAKFQVAIASGTPPDTVLQNSHAQTRWYDSGVHLDLNPLLARDKINLQRDYALIGTEVWCGKTYAMPMDADPNAVFYNKTMLLKNGLRDPWADGKGDWSLDEMIEMARKVTQDTDRDGKIDQWGIAWAYTHPSHVAQFVWTKGSDVADFGNMKYVLDQAASLDAHQQVYNWLVKDKLIISNAEITQIQQQYTRTNPFRTGRVAFHVRAVADVRQNAREIGDSFEWDVLPFPKFNASRPGIPLVSGNPNSVVKESKVPEAAYAWIKHIAGPKGQEVLARTQSLPALKAKQEVFLTTPPNHVKVFQDVYNKPYGIHFRHHYTNDSWDIYTEAVNRIYNGDTPLQAGLQEASRQMNDKIKYGDCQPYKGMAIPI